MKNLSCYLTFFILCFGCQKKSTNKHIHDAQQLTTASLDSGTIVINELAYRAEIENEYGKESDWIELYNNSTEAVLINAGDLVLSDNPSQENKFPLPQIEIPAKGYCIIWCDGEDQLDGDLHANFKLSSKGESVSLFFKGELLDQVFYDSVGSEFKSYKRISDGAQDWVHSAIFSLGQPNS